MLGTEIVDNSSKPYEEKSESYKESLLTQPGDVENRPAENIQQFHEEGCFYKIGQWFAAITNRFQGGSMKGSIFTLIMSTIGTGILMIPNSLAASGLAWGLAQMIFCGWLGYYSLMTIVRCASKAKANSYQELAYITFGQKFRWLINLVFFFGNWGTALLYLKLVSSLISTFIDEFVPDGQIPLWITDTQSKIMPIIVATIFVLPLSLAKELKQLRYLCLVSFAFVVFLCYVVIQEAFSYQPIADGAKSLNQFILGGFFTTFPTAVFAYMSHSNVLDVFGELRDPTLRRMRKVVFRTILIVFLTYAAVGVFGYVAFANNMNVLSDVNKANGIILLAYGFDLEGQEQTLPIIVTISVVTMCIAIIVAEPLNVKPAKDGLKDLFFPRASDENGVPIQTNESTLAHFLLVSFTVYSAVLVAVFAQSVQTVLSMLGGSFATMICFIFPAIFYIKLHQDEPLKGHKLLCWLMLIGMSIFGVWNTIENISYVF